MGAGSNAEWNADDPERLRALLANPMPQLQACMVCGDPVNAWAVHQHVVDDAVVRPLCSICFDRLGGGSDQ